MNVSIIGAGSIGVAFAVVFSRANARVRLQDPDEIRRQAAFSEITQCLQDLKAHGLLDEDPRAVAARVDVTGSLEHAVQDADLVQECAPERVELKREIFQRIAVAVPATAVLASSSSALPASTYAPEGPMRERCLVGHPGNPPYLIPVIEIVPAPFTSAACVQRADELYRQVGLSPVHVRKEVEGFIFNRLQGAVLREAYCLVRDRVADVEDIDTVMRDGLGLRWSFMGPFETSDLNTRGGIASHAIKMGPAYARMGAERGQNDPWLPELVEKVDGQRRALLPLDQWADRVRWRDQMLMRLRRLRRQDKGSAAQ